MYGNVLLHNKFATRIAQKHFSPKFSLQERRLNQNVLPLSAGSVDFRKLSLSLILRQPVYGAFKLGQHFGAFFW